MTTIPSTLQSTTQQLRMSSNLSGSDHDLKESVRGPGAGSAEASEQVVDAQHGAYHTTAYSVAGAAMMR
jgi:hypothetical protein